MAKNRRTKDENETATVDYRKPVPDWVRAAINEHMGNDIEEANQLAADILMPWKLLDPILDSGQSDICELADMFKVSPKSLPDLKGSDS